MTKKQRFWFVASVSIAVFIGTVIIIGLWLGWYLVLRSHMISAVLAALFIAASVVLFVICRSRRWLLPWLIFQILGNLLIAGALTAGIVASYSKEDVLTEAALGSWILAFIGLRLGRRAHLKQIETK